MPAHGARHTIGNAVKSDSSRVTATEWRANRLVDAVAKSAAAATRVEQRVMKSTEGAAAALRYSAAKLGTVTHAASHCAGTVTDANGCTKTVMRRDAVAPRFRQARSDIGVARRGRAGPIVTADSPAACPVPLVAASSSGGLAGVIGGGASTGGTALSPSRVRGCQPRSLASVLSAARAAAATKHYQREQVCEATRLARWCRSSATHAATGLSASERLAALRERIRAREMAAASSAAPDAPLSGSTCPPRAADQ